MRLLYLSGSYFPSRRASSVQIMQMAAALAARGHELTVIGKRCESRQVPSVPDLHAYYGVASNFSVVSLPRPAWKGGGLVFSASVARFLRKRAGAYDLGYARDVTSALLAGRRGLPFVFEAHGAPRPGSRETKLRRLLHSPQCLRLVTISGALMSHMVEQRIAPGGLSRVIAHDAAAPMRRAASQENRPLREFSDRKRVGYVGRLYPGKGAEMILQLARRLPDHRFHVVGGDASELEGIRGDGTPSNLQFHGFVPPHTVPDYYRDFDVVLLPYGEEVRGATGQSDLAPWMSPLKLFEAMSAGKAIVASDLPVLREVLEDGLNCLLAPPGDVEAWAQAVSSLTRSPELRNGLAEAAYSGWQKRHTWDSRVRRVLDGLTL